MGQISLKPLTPVSPLNPVNPSIENGLNIVSTTLNENHMTVTFNRPISMKAAIAKLFPDSVSIKDIPPKFQISGGGNETVEVTTAKGKIYQLHIPPRGCFGPPSTSVTVTDVSNQKQSLPIDRIQLPHPSELKPLPNIVQKMFSNPNADNTLKEIVNGNPSFQYFFEKPVVSLKDLLPIIAPDSKIISEESTEKGQSITYLNSRGNQESLYLYKDSNQVEQRVYRDPSLPGMGLLYNVSESLGGKSQIEEFNQRLKQ
jgi:hypothetical protein